MTSAAIIGASGFSGQETLDRVLAHPELELLALGSDSLAGAARDRARPAPRPQRPRRAAGVRPNDEALASGADVVFLCLDHERAAALEPPADGVVVDLSGAHRLDAADYPAWYGFDHPSPDASTPGRTPAGALPPDRPAVANPGCYATAALLALAPLADAIDPATVVVDGKSGVSGAGKSLKPTLARRRRARERRAVPRRRAPARARDRAAARLPGLLRPAPPAGPPRPDRDLLREADAGDLRDRLEAAYAATPAVALLPEGATPDLARVQGTDAAEVALFEDRATGRAIVVCAIDNLGKGAAGQAVQNANLVLGLDETAGLRLHGVLV